MVDGIFQNALLRWDAYVQPLHDTVVVLVARLMDSCALFSWCGKDISVVSLERNVSLKFECSNRSFPRSVIIDSLQRTFISPDVATVFIFCQDEKDKEQTSVDLLRNILAQLVYRRRSLSYATSSLYYSESLTEGRATAKAYQNAIRAEVNRFSKVFLVVDGLDMLYDKDRFLSRLEKLPGNAQLLFTLRDAPLAGNSSYVDVRASSEDLQQYTLSHLKLDSNLRGLLQENGSWKYGLLCEVVRLLAEKSNGV